MNEKWRKGEPVSLQDLLRITPLVQEALQASEEMNVSLADLFWLMRKMAGETQAFSGFEEGTMSLEELLETGDFTYMDDLEELLEEPDMLYDLDDEEEESGSAYTVSIKINGAERFPEVSFRAKVMDKADLSGFFEWMADMVEKLD